MRQGRFSRAVSRPARADPPRLRKIHVDLPEEVHKKLRVKAALQDTSIRAFVAYVVGEAVKDVVIPAQKSGHREKPE